MAYLRVLIVGILLLAGITGGVFSVHSCLMNTAPAKCSVVADNDCCCADEPAADEASAQSDMSCCKTTSPYFNIPVYGVVKLIDINPTLIHSFISVSVIFVKQANLTVVTAFNSDDPPDKLQGSDILIRIERFLI